MQMRLDEALPRNTSPSLSHTSSELIPSPVPPVPTPFATIRAARNQLSIFESKLKLPAILDFDQSVLAIPPNYAPLLAYEKTLNGLLEQLDAIESDSDEELEPPAAQGAAPFEATVIAESDKSIGLGPSATVSPDDADVDLAIYEEYLPSLPVVESSKLAVAELANNAAESTTDASFLDADKTTRVLANSEDAVATITTTPASRFSSDVTYQPPQCQ